MNANSFIARKYIINGKVHQTHFRERVSVLLVTVPLRVCAWPVAGVRGGRLPTEGTGFTQLSNSPL